MCPLSGETTVFMRHSVLVTLCGWLSGMQGGIPQGTSVAYIQLFLLMMGT